MTSIPQAADLAGSQRACRLCRSLHLSSAFSVDPTFRHSRQDARERRRQENCSRHGHLQIWACAGAAASQWDCSQRQPTIPQPQQQQKPHRRWRQLLWWAALLSVLWATAGSFQSSSKFASITVTATGASRETVRHAVRSAYAGLAAGGLHSLAGVDHLAVGSVLLAVTLACLCRPLGDECTTCKLSVHASRLFICSNPCAGCTRISLALTPFTIGRSTVKASLLGALWGFGHSTGQLILGIAMVVLKDRFQQLVPVLDKCGAATVGLTLLAIGVLGLLEARQQEEGIEQLQPITASGPTIPSELGSGSGSLLPKQQDEQGLRYSVGIFVTGIVYGLQPDALFVIIPALTLPTKLAAAAYTLMFVFGTCAAMGGYTAVIASASRQLPKSMNSRLASISSSIAVVVGLLVLASGFGVPLPFSLSLAP